MLKDVASHCWQTKKFSKNHIWLSWPFNIQTTQQCQTNIEVPKVVKLNYFKDEDRTDFTNLEVPQPHEKQIWNLDVLKCFVLEDWYSLTWKLEQTYELRPWMRKGVPARIHTQTWKLPNIAQWVQEGEDVGKDAGDHAPQEEKTIFGTEIFLYSSLFIESIVLLSFWVRQPGGQRWQ